MEKILFIFFFILIFGCDTIALPDYYRVYKDPNNSDLDENTLMCKLGCEKDIVIDGIKNLEWNSKLIYIIQRKGSADNYFIIMARGQKLMCCNRDISIGPLTLEGFHNQILKLGLPKELQYHKSFW